MAAVTIAAELAARLHIGCLICAEHPGPGAGAGALRGDGVATGLAGRVASRPLAGYDEAASPRGA